MARYIITLNTPELDTSAVKNHLIFLIIILHGFVGDSFIKAQNN